MAAVPKLSRFQQNFRNMPDDYYDVLTSQKYEPVCYFVYGTLANPKILTAVTGAKEAPEMISATITGYEIKLWDQYPALQQLEAAKLGSAKPIEGKAFLVNSFDLEDRLQDHETYKYSTCYCLINLPQGVRVLGKTFVWAGEATELSEGEWDLKKYLATAC